MEHRSSDKWPALHGIPAIFGIYNEELEMARVVHNLEHGGIYILYGKDVPDSTVDELRSFYESHKTGTIMAPLDRLGDKFALGAWVVDGETKNGFLAKCTTIRRRRGLDVLPLAPVPRARAIRSESAPAGHVVGRKLVPAGVAERVRRARLKSGCPSGRAGSSPAPGIVRLALARAEARTRADI